MTDTPKLSTATNPDELVEAACRWVWYDRHGGDCPPDLIGSVASVARHWRNHLQTTMGMKNELIGDLFPDGSVDRYFWDHFTTQHQKWRDSGGRAADHPVVRYIEETYWKDGAPVPSFNGRDDRILPRDLAIIQGTELTDSRNRLFRVPPKGTSQTMPIFDDDYLTPSLPLHLYDLGVGEAAKNQGSGAPLALRLFVESCLSVNQRQRGIGPVSMDIPMKRILKQLYPGRPPRPNEWVPKLHAAVAVLESEEARIDWGGGLQRVVTVTNLPYQTDHIMRIVVDLPPGTEVGPQVSPRLQMYGPKHGVAYRLLLNLAYWWHEPGRTLHPIKDGKLWVQSEDPKRYRKMTDAELLYMAFPNSATKHHRVLLQRARKALDQLIKDGEARVVDGKVLPPKRGD